MMWLRDCFTLFHRANNDAVKTYYSDELKILVFLAKTRIRSDK